MLFIDDAGDMMDFHLQENSFHYQIRLTGNVVNNVQSFQGCMVSSHNAHLCILDTENRLSYYHWKGVKWQPVRTWQQVAPSFQSALDLSGIFHLVIQSAEGNRFFSYSGQTEQEEDLLFLKPNSLLLQLYAIDQDNLLLVQQENLASVYHITYYCYHNPSHTWSDKKSMAHLPLDCQSLQLFLSNGNLYLTYITPKDKVRLLNILTVNGNSGETVENCLGELSPTAGVPVMSKLDDDIVLVFMEPQNLIYWRSRDQGQTWTTKGELPCPWPLLLAPVFNPQREITDCIAVEGFYELNLEQPALLKTKELLSLSPYGLWI